MPAEFRPKPILQTLIAHDVDFVLIGGMAGIARGSSYPSYDVDIAYARDRDNLITDPDGAPAYERLRQAAGEPVQVEGEPIRVASLDHLIAMKEASGRTKDKLMATEYRVVSDEIRRTGKGSDRTI